MSKIPTILELIHEHERELVRLRSELYAERCNELGIHEGDVVLCKGKTFQVCGLNFNFGEKVKPWARGFVKKKDGEWSKTPTHLYTDWEKIA